MSFCWRVAPNDFYRYAMYPFESIECLHKPICLVFDLLSWDSWCHEPTFLWDILRRGFAETRDSALDFKDLVAFRPVLSKRETFIDEVVSLWNLIVFDLWHLYFEMMSDEEPRRKEQDSENSERGWNTYWYVVTLFCNWFVFSWRPVEYQFGVRLQPSWTLMNPSMVLFVKVLKRMDRRKAQVMHASGNCAPCVFSNSSRVFVATESYWGLSFLSDAKGVVFVIES